MLTKEEAKSVLECKWRLKQVNTYLIAWTLAAGLTLPFALFKSVGSNHDYLGLGFGIWAGMMCLYGIPLLAVALYSYWQYTRIRKHFHSFRQYRVRLDHPGTSWMYKGAVYYTVSFRAEDGQYITMDTKPLWSTRGLDPIPLEDYNNQEVTILYDPQMEQVIVVGLVK